MIKTPIEFTGELATEITTFSQEGRIVNGFWTDECLTSVRKKIKDFYKTAQGFECPYCLQRIAVNHGRAWDIDHIVPNAQCANYMFEPKNLCVSCLDCNIFKLDKPVLNGACTKRYPEDPSRFKIAHPHYDSHQDHLVFLQPGFFLAISEKGRYTMDFCNLHRFGYMYSFNEDILTKLPGATELWNTFMEAKTSDEVEVIVRRKGSANIEIKVSAKA